MTDALTVVKVGGAVLDDEARCTRVLSAFASIGSHALLVHGGGVLASEMQRRLGIEPVMIGGRRVTDDETLRVVTMTYAGWINKNIAARLRAAGCNALGIAASDGGIVQAERRSATPLDYGHVGNVLAVDAVALLRLLAAGFTPVVAPITSDAEGALLNTNADTIAAEIAIALGQSSDVTLLYCFEHDGVLADVHDARSRLRTLSRLEARALERAGVIGGGMLPKLENAFRAAELGVRRVVVCNADDLGAVTKGGAPCGTEITI
jgi:acetylglutamate kinase